MCCAETHKSSNKAQNQQSSMEEETKFLKDSPCSAWRRCRFEYITIYQRRFVHVTWEEVKTAAPIVCNEQKSQQCPAIKTGAKCLPNTSPCQKHTISTIRALKQMPSSSMADCTYPTHPKLHVTQGNVRKEVGK